MKALEKRNYIIEKCYRLLLQKGFDAVSISDIQKECGVARGLLYHYFGSKEELFYEVVRKVVLSKFFIHIDETSKMNLRALLGHTCNKYREILLIDKLEGISLVNYDFLIYRAVQESAEVRLLNDTLRSHEKDAVKRAILQSIENEDMKICVDPDDLALFIVSLIDGVWMNSLEQGSSEELITRLENMLALNLSLLNHK